MAKRWHNLQVEEVLGELQASRSGLSEEEARRRLFQHRASQLVEKRKTSKALIFLRQFAVSVLVAEEVRKSVNPRIFSTGRQAS